MGTHPIFESDFDCLTDMSDPVILSYFDSLLRQSDIALLEKPNWLNDKIIGFAFQYYQEDVFKNENVCLVDPSVTQMVKLCSSPFDVQALLSSLELEKKSIVLISINDNDSVEAGGSHWSLLAWVKTEKKFYHFDSWGNAPSKHSALQTANKISAAIGSPMPVDLSEMEVNRQENGYECGMHVLEIAYQLIDTKFYFSVDSWQPDCVNVSQCRLRLKSAVARLAKESTPISPLLMKKEVLLVSKREEFEKNLEKLVFEEISLVSQDFNLTTKLNQAAGFQFGKVESELGAIATKMTESKLRQNQIETLESKLDDLLEDLENVERNVNKLESYSKKLEDQVEKHFK